ncbi:MAG: hypothetical protein QOG63_1117, partial [Thermoleophilaceae bacterium]|nr:hypothetical protein [Thermoleophilaceae bacterium]
LVLTDGAIQALKDMTPMPPTAVSMHKVYAGQSSFATDASHPTTSDKLARGVEQQGARFGSGMRRQMFEPTPLGFAIQDPAGGDAAASPEWDIDRSAWETAGGRTVATSIDSDPSNAAAVFDRVSIGELKIGDGQIRFAGALLPQPTEDYDHEFGLEPYSATYTGYIIARNLLDAGRTRTSGESGNPGGEPGKDTVGGKFVISRRLVKLRPHSIARVHVRCKARRGCHGRLHLRVVKRVRSNHNRRKLVEIGQRKFRYKKARRAVIRIRLTGEGRKLIGRHRRLRIRAAAPVRFGNGTGGVAKRRFWLERAAHRPH